MKTTTAFGLVATISVAGIIAFTSSKPRSGPAEFTGANPSKAIPVAILTDVRQPVTLSAQAGIGKSFFDGVCASCHGANAAGQDRIAPPLIHQLYVSSHHGDAAFVTAVRNGARQHHWSFGNMPPLEQRLTDGELDAIIRYIRELQRENGIL